jgi:hypothetical protein
MKRSAQPFLWRAHEDRRAVDAPEAQLLLEIAGHVRRAVVVADREAAGDALREAAEVAPHPLAERLQRLEAGGVMCGVDADALGGALGRLRLPSWRYGSSALPMMIDGDEHRRLTLAGHPRGRVGAPWCRPSQE